MQLNFLIRPANQFSKRIAIPFASDFDSVFIQCGEEITLKLKIILVIEESDSFGFHQKMLGWLVVQYIPAGIRIFLVVCCVLHFCSDLRAHFFLAAASAASTFTKSSTPSSNRIKK